MPLPASWLKSDIGAVGTAGDANESAGTYTITGAGRDLCGRADGFHYAFRNAEYASGNEEIIARVATQGNTHAYAKDGDSSVTLNPAGFLSNGDIYEVIYAGNPLGDPVIPATRYTGGNITISTVVRELAPFVGGVERVADSLPGFGAFILYKR